MVRQSWHFEVQRWIDPSLLVIGAAIITFMPQAVLIIRIPLRGCMPRHASTYTARDLAVAANSNVSLLRLPETVFTGKNDKVSVYPYLLRYDVEVSGFGSHQSGHLCLLRLKGADVSG